jgi:hypothetical protein
MHHFKCTEMLNNAGTLIHYYIHISQSAAKAGVSGEKKAAQQQSKADSDTRKPEEPDVGGKADLEGEEGSAEGSAESSDDDDADNDCCVLCKGSESSTKVSTTMLFKVLLCYCCCSICASFFFVSVCTCDCRHCHCRYVITNMNVLLALLLIHIKFRRIFKLLQIIYIGCTLVSIGHIVN